MGICDYTLSAAYMQTTPDFASSFWSCHNILGMFPKVSVFHKKSAKKLASNVPFKSWPHFSDREWPVFIEMSMYVYIICVHADRKYNILYNNAYNAFGGDRRASVNIGRTLFHQSHATYYTVSVCIRRRSKWWKNGHEITKHTMQSLNHATPTTTAASTCEQESSKIVGRASKILLFFHRYRCVYAVHLI